MASQYPAWWRKGILLGLLLAGAPLVLPGAGAAFQADGENQHAADADPVAHGRYLVHQVAMCVECHSPRNERGQLIEQSLLEGGPIRVSRPFANMAWALEAPKLAGLPGGWTRESLAHLLQTGETPTGPSLRPPMPPFRMNQHDALAVADYLLSLGK